MPNVPIALQLYTVREELEKDFEATLRDVAAIGYAGVEFTAYGERPASAVCGLLAELGLQPVAAHVPIEDLEKDSEAVIEYNLEVGVPYLVIPSLPENRRRDRKKWRATANLLSDIARDLQDYELRLCYHNHDFEFETFGEDSGWDILFDAADPDLVKAELDAYWVKYAGQDPAESIRKLAGRCPLIHLKDMADDSERSPVEVGAGVLDLDAIFEAAEASGVEWYIVEQDACARPPLESARISFENLKTRGKA